MKRIILIFVNYILIEHCVLIEGFLPKYRQFSKFSNGIDCALNTYTESIAKTTDSNDPQGPKEQTWECLTQSLIDGWAEGLKGRSSSLQSIVSKETKWDNPFVSTVADLYDGMQKFSEFFEEPSVVLFNKEKTGPTEISIEYQVSFWYPSPWRPRIIIPAKAIVITDKDFTKVLSVKENWDISVLDIFLKQFLPRLWDIWHLFCSPTPEYPPIKSLSSVGKVSFVEIPSTVVVEVTWTGLARYPGPPLLSAPGFSLFGELRTSRPNRDNFYTVLPVEVQTSRYTSSTGEEMKSSSWIYHIPTELQPKILDKAYESKMTSIIDNDEEGSEDDLIQNVDYIVGLENLNVMKRVTGGTERGEGQINNTMMEEFGAYESKVYRYRILPKRIIALTSIYGEAKTELISNALKTIRETVDQCNAGDGVSVPSGPPKKMKILPISSLYEGRFPANTAADNNQLGLRLCYMKGCFNMNAEPAMAIYEMQYNQRKTQVFLELKPV